MGTTNMQIENIKKDQSEIKTTLQGIKIGVDDVADQINDLEDKEAKITQSGQETEKKIQKMRIV